MKLKTLRLLSRGGYALADQVLSSGTNFATAIIVARLLGPADYGSFALVYGAWIVVMSFTRVMIINPYILEASSLDPGDWLTVTRTAAGIALGGGLLGGIVIAVIGICLGIGHTIGQALVAISLFSPALVLQDFWRFAAFSIAKPRMALSNDAVWALVQASAFLMIWLCGWFHVALLISGWGVGALAGAIFGAWQFRTTPGIDRHCLQWLRKNASISGWFGMSNFIYSAGSQAIAVLITAMVGRAALGGIQSVNNLFGPAQLISQASQTLGLPMASKARAEGGPQAVRRFAVRYTLVVGFCLTGYAILILGAGPFLLGKVFGKAFYQYGTLIMPLALAFLLNSLGTGAAVGLIASAAGRQLAQVGLLTIGTQIVMIWLLVSRFGVSGAVWGMALGALVRCIGISLSGLHVTRSCSVSIVSECREHYIESVKK